MEEQSHWSVLGRTERGGRKGEGEGRRGRRGNTAELEESSTGSQGMRDNMPKNPCTNTEWTSNVHGATLTA